MLRLHTLGGCLVERDGARLEAMSANRKGLALLAIVAAAGERGVSRETLLGLLWPESDDERARTSLRQLSHSLRTQLDAPDLLLPSAELRLNPAVMESDVAQFRAAIANDDPESAVALYIGPFLDGFVVRGADEFERWASSERDNLASAAAQALQRLARAAEQRNDPAAALDFWRRHAKAEPYSAQAALSLMRALDAAGERAAAIQHARVYELMLREEFGDAPDEAVSALADELRRAPPRPTVAAPRPSAKSETAAAERPQRRRALVALALVATLIAGAFALSTLAGDDPDLPPSLAVLPLASVSGDPPDEVISDGLTENLIGALAQRSNLRVIARTSSFAFKKRESDLRQIADSLGVDVVVEGSVQRVGSKLKVNVQLVNAADATVLWASTYDRELSDLLAVQDDITLAIVEALRARLRDHVRDTRLVRDVEAYELYLRGRHIFTTGTDRSTTDNAHRYFQLALRRDSLMAEAHAGMSDVYARLGVFGFTPAPQAYAAAKAAALRALVLNPSLGEAHAALGHLRCVAEFDWTNALRDFERAVTLAPNYTFGRLPYAICLALMGRLHDALQQLAIARSYDPLSAAVPNVAGRVHVYLRQPDSALVQLRQALELSPRMDLAHQQMGHAYLQLGRTAEAIKAFEQAARMSGARDSLHLAYAYARAGDRARALHIVNGVVQDDARASSLAFHLAMAYTGLNDHDRAFAWLERGLRERISFMSGTAIDPAFDPLRADARWRAVLKAMRLPDL